MDYLEKVLRAHGAMVGRMLIGLLFVFSGVGIVTGGIDGFAGMIEMKDIPMPILVAWFAVAIKIAAGTALIAGYQTRYAALALIIFTLVATLLYHMDLQDVNLFKNLAIVGGLLYVYVYGPGAGWRLKVGKSNSEGPISAI